MKCSVRLLALLTLLLCTGLSKGAPTDTTLVLLGTAGGPGAQSDRAGIASLLSVNGKQYLIDAGYGLSQQLARAGVAEKDVSEVFLTHLHDDHTAGLAELMTFAYTTRIAHLEVIGPPRTGALVDAALALLDVSAEIRRVENRIPASPREVFVARDVQPGLVYADQNVRVTAAENSHFNFKPDSAEARNRSYALRFQTPDKVIVFTGDTGVSEPVAELARGADILVAEVVTPEAVASVPAAVREHMEKEHLSLAQVGQLAAKAGVKTLVLSHGPKLNRSHLAEIRRHFSGRIVAGQDLARF
jgi:ribonuclease BN (tRNA processing enzyme)